MKSSLFWHIKSCSPIQVEYNFAYFFRVQEETKKENTMKQAASKDGFFLSLLFQA
jgi:hypothetical protein